MFDIGFAELLVIGVVALLVLGPEKLPLAAKTCGLWLGRIRRSVNNIQREINEELRVEELRRTTAMEKEKLDEELAEMRKPFAFNEAETKSASATSGQSAPEAKSTGDDAEQANSVKKSPADD
ncbi:Sec-independent protein translocase protein TatB [Marinobacterium mangrovicola]|uniref:Sec-independent protein translocase protein TatB n=1 Tax=Marinobacterium mangrovicola TaxID=1476959 RepID=A0A4V2PD21_9GAMM|nr:Sec-independent protein translocase protein TatB [Marinobacterium mangrovicola]TCK03476.1 Sec-independent protein translocase TatB [Marinobacterium mangrovicola]